MADGSEVALHRRATLLNGSGSIYPGLQSHIDKNCRIDFATHEFALMETRKAV